MSTDEKIIKNKVGLLKLSENAGQRLGGLQSHGIPGVALRIAVFLGWPSPAGSRPAFSIVNSCS